MTLPISLFLARFKKSIKRYQILMIGLAFDFKNMPKRLVGISPGARVSELIGIVPTDCELSFFIQVEYICHLDDNFYKLSNKDNRNDKTNGSKKLADQVRKARDVFYLILQLLMKNQSNRFKFANSSVFNIQRQASLYANKRFP